MVARQRGAVGFLGILLLLLFRAPGTHAADPPWKIDEQIAQRLAAEGWGRGISPKWFDYDPGISQHFFVFDGINKPPANGSFDFLAVNPWTGDVWALWECQRLWTPALQKSKARIRRRFTSKEAKEYRRLVNLKPECI
jgi:hypothetical protein